MRHWLLILAALPLCGCVYYVVPKVVTYRDEDCDIEFRQMTLTVEQMQLLGPGDECAGEAGCWSMVAGKVLSAPASAIVSGPIVIVGNTVFWLEKQGRCLTK